MRETGSSMPRNVLARHRRPAATIRCRNCCVRGSRGAEKICSGGPCSRIDARVEEADAVGDLAREAPSRASRSASSSRRRRARGSPRAPRRRAPGRARSSPRRAASARAPSRARARSRRAAAGRPRAGRGTRRRLSARPKRREQLERARLGLGARPAEHRARRERDVAQHASCAGRGCTPGRRSRSAAARGSRRRRAR